jgi:hypothetical protein
MKGYLISYSKWRQCYVKTENMSTISKQDKNYIKYLLVAWESQYDNVVTDHGELS